LSKTIATTAATNPTVMTLSTKMMKRRDVVGSLRGGKDAAQRNGVGRKYPHIGVRPAARDIADRQIL